MKYKDLTNAEFIATKMRKVKEDYTSLNLGGVLGITFRGTYQPESVLAEIRPHVAALMSADYTALTNELVALGVTDIPPIDPPVSP